MDRTEAAGLLRRELESYAGRPFEELVSLIGKTDAYAVRGETGIEYQLEIDALWDAEEGGLLRVLGSIDDGTFRAAFSPVTDDLLVQPPTTD